MVDRWIARLCRVALFSGLAVAAIIAASGMAAGQTAAPLVYVCPGVQGPQPPACVNAQELEVFDHNGAPVFSVGEAGGAHSFGDVLAVNGTSITMANVTLSWQPPPAGPCRAPAGGAIWIDSANGGEVWACLGGAWMRRPL